MKTLIWTLAWKNKGKHAFILNRWPAPILLLSASLLCGCKTVTPTSWYNLRYSPDGTRLAAFRVGGGVTEFALPKDQTGRTVALPFDQQTGKVIDLNYNASGDLLLLCHVTNQLTVWNTRQGAVVAHRPLQSSLLGGRFSRNGERAVLCFAGKQGGTNVSIALVDLKPGGNITELPEHQGLIDFKLSAGGERLATVDGQHVGRVWNAQTGQLLPDMPGQGQRPLGVALDEHGNNLALFGVETRIERVDETGQSAISVPNAAPKATTALGGVGLIFLQVGTAAVGNGYMAWDPYWFKTAPTLGVSLSDDGSRIAMINPAPNLKGCFQIRVTDTQTGGRGTARDLPASFVPCGPPVFSPNGLQVAVPGNGVHVLDFSRADSSKAEDSWVAKDQPAPSSAMTRDKHEIPYGFKVEPVRATNSGSWLARAAHRRVSLEETVNASGQPEYWTLPLGLGMKNVYYPSKPVGLFLNESLVAVWRDCGHEPVHWNADLHLSSRVTKWQLEVEHSLFKGWDMTAVVEIELALKDDAGNVLHTARYAGSDHQTKSFEPSDSFIGKMHARVLSLCLGEMKNDPRWEQALAIRAPASPKPL